MYLAHKEKRKIVLTILLETIREQYDTSNEKFEPLSVIKRFEEHSNVTSEGYKEQLDKITFKGQKSETVSLVFENIRLIEELIIFQKKNITPANIQEYLIKMPLTRITNVSSILLSSVLTSDVYLSLVDRKKDPGSRASRLPITLYLLIMRIVIH